MKAKPPPTLREALRQPETVAARLSVAERILLFCITSHTDWQKPDVTGATVTAMAVRGLIERDAAARLSLTDEGREVLAALLLGRAPSRSPDGRDSEAEVGSFVQPLARPSSTQNGARRHCFRPEERDVADVAVGPVRRRDRGHDRGEPCVIRAPRKIATSANLCESDL